MLTLRQAFNLLGLYQDASAKELAGVYGIMPTFSLKQVLELVGRGNVSRPFYIIGHNTNSIAEVNAALTSGANAVEIDVNVYENRQNELCVSEVGTLDTDAGGSDNAPRLDNFLSQLRTIALANPENFALVIFDCKPKTATSNLGVEILRLARNALLLDTNLNLIISVSSLKYGAIFDQISSDLRKREGVMVDEENDPSKVHNFFSGISNSCYGNGVAPMFNHPILSPHVRPSIERACAMRTGFGSFKFVYTWTVGEEDQIREYLRIGVDGIIPGKTPSTFDETMTLRLLDILQEAEFKDSVRVAKRSDNPFARPDTGYAIQVHTGNVHNAGTDANLSFVLTGSLGSATKDLDASLIGSVFGKTPGRMERNAWDFVTIRSLNVGELLSIFVRRDDKGNAPDWYLNRVIVSSARYKVNKQAVFNGWIGKSGTSQPLS